MSAVPWYIKAVLRLAIPAACLAALYLSIPGEVALAKTAGWSQNYSYAMPVCLSVYALAAGAISQYRRKMKLPGEKTALIGGVLALGLAMSAQSISHLIAQSYMGTSAVLVVAVSCVPPLVIAHLIHMAETPAEVRSASEELEETREMNRALMTALVGSEGARILSHAGSVLAEVGEASEAAEELSEETEELVKEIEEALKESAEKPRRRGALALTRDKVEETRKTLAAQGEKVTVARICETLGVSQATYYRHIAA